MKCPNCNGTGYVKYFDSKNNNMVSIPCSKCKCTGYVELTNEKWFCSLPTEEKAKVFIAICRDAFRAENYRRKHWSDLQTIEFWVKWLKQPHREE